MTTFYRGIKVTDENVSKETKKSNAGIYRGVKHGTKIGRASCRERV